MKIILFTLYFPPDLGAGSFRSDSLVKELSKKLNVNSQIHVITSHPNRYLSHKVDAEDEEKNENIYIHRISIPSHGEGMMSQARTYAFFAYKAFKLSLKIKPDFIIGTTSRLMTGLLTYIAAKFQKCNYFIDLRDIFSETISDIYKTKNRFFSIFCKFLFSKIEHKVLCSASGVNVVSEGFNDYFEKMGIDTSNWFFFPNGVDDVFIDFYLNNRMIEKPIKTILYAGNIGSGQGLEKIIPDIAIKLEKNYKFVIIGDGSSLRLLERRVKQLKVNNVQIFPPVSRLELLNHYRDCDILFLHLNDFKAFERVLPSKIFEYAALGKPIVAGLNGYAANFIRTHINYSKIFNPRDTEQAINCILSVNYSEISNSNSIDFTNKFSRRSIMGNMTRVLKQIIEENVD